MMLFHYYNKNVEAMKSISENDCAAPIDILSQQNGKAYNRFRNYNRYIEHRIAAEKWLYSSFVAKGGKPMITKPRYFILGEDPHLKSCFGTDAAEITISLDSIDENDVSFTLGDSVAIQIDHKQQVVYTKKELFHMAELMNISTDELVEQYRKENTYIEAQVWNTIYFTNADATTYHALF